MADDFEDLTELEHKVAKSELRARDAEARRKIIESEIAILELRERLSKLKNGG